MILWCGTFFSVPIYRLCIDLKSFKVHGDFGVAPDRATDSPAEAGIADLAVV